MSQLKAMERKNWEIKGVKCYEVKDDNGNFGVIEGYLSVFGNVDSWGDIVHKGAFIKTLSEKKRFPLRDEHETTIGIFSGHEDEYGLFIKGEIHQEVQAGREAYLLAKMGAKSGLSIGYRSVPGKWDMIEIDGIQIRNLREIRLMEGSIVTFPANEEAVITNVKHEDQSLDAGSRNSTPLSEPISDTGEPAKSYLLEVVSEFRKSLNLEIKKGVRHDTRRESHDRDRGR